MSRVRVCVCAFFGGVSSYARAVVRGADGCMRGGTAGVCAPGADWGASW
jgi:hypothetical protein